MKRIILSFSLLMVFALGSVMAQESETETVKDKPVRSPFESGYLIDNQTSVIQPEKTLQFAIQHKFGSIENGSSDLWGLYSPGSNVRLSLDYVVYKNVQLGIGVTKKDMLTDFNAKWTILEQTRQNTIPFALTFFGNIAIDGRADDVYGKDYEFSNRLSSFAQIIVGRKFSDAISLQAAASYSHYNIVNDGFYHDMMGAHFNGRIKLTPQGSFIFNYDMPIKIASYSRESANYTDPEPSFTFGYEVSTSTHAFQIYAGTANSLVQQDMMVNNRNKIEKDNFMIGFTITRLWNF